VLGITLGSTPRHLRFRRDIMNYNNTKQIELVEKLQKRYRVRAKGNIYRVKGIVHTLILESMP